MSDLTYQLPANPTLADVRAILEKGEHFLNNCEDGTMRVDCSQAAMITSMVLGSLVRLHNQYAKRGRTFLLTNVSDQMRSSLRSSSLIHVFKTEQSDERPVFDIDAAIVNISVEIDFELVGDIGVFSFSGSMLTPSDTEIFYNMGKKIIEDGHQMLIDMADLVYIGSMGLGAIMRLHKIMAEQKRGEIRICSPGAILKDMLEKQSLTSVLKIFDTREAALSGWVK